MTAESAIALPTLASYVPPLVIRHLAQHGSGELAPAAERSQAAVLFADVSGFTALAERLSSRGPVGAEDLTRVLNSYFGQLVDVIAAHGGEVTKFAGDALLALWPAAGDLAAATRRAAQCALALQTAIKQVDLPEIRLALKMIIGAGDVVVMQLGGVAGRWECIVAGAPLIQVSLAEPMASPGDVVVSPEAWRLLRPYAVGDQLRVETVRLTSITQALPVRPAPPPPLEAVPPAALRAYIPQAVLNRLQAGQADWLAELRAVTVLFINLDINYWTPLEAAQATIAAVQTILDRFEGNINKLSVDEKGVTLVAAIGLPPLAHEDNAVRGVQVASQAHSALASLGVEHSIGVTSGRVFCGVIGSTSRREYTIIGDLVNLAARLMSKADDILTDAATYEVARERIDFAALPPLTVKGKSEPVSVYRPRGISHPTLQIQSAIVGREHERARFASALAALAEHGASSVILLEGIGGIGKSRLIADLIDQARQLGVQTLLGAGDAIEQATPYYAWRAILTRIFELDTARDEAARREQVLELLADQPAALRLAPLLDDILALDLPDNQWTAHMTGQVRADNLRALVGWSVQAAARHQPLVLVVEDVHWLDSASWALIAGVQQSVHPLMLVVVTRPWENAVPAEWTRLLALPITQHLQVENLPAEQAITLVCQRLGVAEIPPAAADLITSKAEGHPFWSEEIAYTLRDTGVLIIADGVCRLAPHVGGIADIDIPNTIQGIITSRIDRLSASQQLAIKVASVIGRVFLLTTLMDIYPVPGDRPRLPGDLGSLSSLDVTPLNNTAQLTYFFKHVITQNVAYSLIPFAQRRLLHRSIAEWFEQTYRQDLEPYYPALVHHWRAAEDPARLIDALEQAGAHALHSGAYLEAATAFRDALAVAREQPAPPPILRRARWERQLGQALAGLGNVAESQAHLETALEILQQPVPGGSRRVMLGWVEQMASQLGRQWRPAALAGPAQQETYLEAARAYYELWTLYNGSNEPIMALHAAWRMLNLAEMAGPSPELGQAYALVCFLSMAVPRVADSYERRARSAAQSISRPAERSRLLLPLGRYYAYTGHWLEAEQALGEALGIAEGLGDRRQWEEIAGDIAMMAYHRGQFARGAALGESIRASARDRASTFAASLGLYTQALNLLPLGAISQAIPILEEGTALLEEQRSDLYRITSWGLLALAYAERGDLGQAERAAEKVVQVAAHSSPAAVVGFGYPGATEVWLRLWDQAGDDGSRRHYARQAEQMVKQVRQAVRLAPVFQPSGWRLRGLAAHLRGHQQTAYNAWWYGLQAAERLSMPYQAALLHATIARLGPPAERSLHTRLAGDIFRQLGVSPEIS